MDSEEPPNVRVACSGDIDEVVRLMHDAAAWMSAKGTPAWDVARIDRTFAETFVLRSELLVASCSDGIVGCCTLSAEDPEFWPDALKGEAAYLHKLAARLPPEPAWPIRAARIHPRRHFQSRLGSNLHRRTPRTRNLTSVRASRSMSGWDGPVASRSLAVRPRCLGCARGCRYLLICTQI